MKPSTELRNWLHKLNCKNPITPFACFLKYFYNMAEAKRRVQLLENDIDFYIYIKMRHMW